MSQMGKKNLLNFHSHALKHHVKPTWSNTCLFSAYCWAILPHVTTSNDDQPTTLQCVQNEKKCYWVTINIMQTCRVLHNVKWKMMVMLAYVFSGLQTSGTCINAPD